MRLWPKRTPKPRPERDFADELHRAAMRLTGWTVSGTTSIDLPGLLGAAAVEIQRYESEVRLLVRASDRLAAAVAHRIELGHLDARSEAGDALLDWDSLDDHRAAVGIEPREGRIGL